MKRALIAALAVCALVVFTACGKSTKDEGNTTPAVTESQTTEDENKETTPPASQEAPGETSEFKVLTGSVKEVSDNLDSMVMMNGEEEVTLDLKNVTVETSFALDAEVRVSVVYKGEISGADASNATLLMVLDGQDGMEVKEVTGSVVDQAMSSFTIKTADGTELGFLKNNCEGLNTGVLGKAADDSNGSGAMIKVTYVSVNYDAGSVSNFPLRVEAAE